MVHRTGGKCLMIRIRVSLMVTVRVSLMVTVRVRDMIEGSASCTAASTK